MDSLLAEIAESLAMDDIPVKLRCAACNSLATNAFRTPCCDQSICESCQSSLPQACPICLHEPVKAEDCRPNKTLRMTIRAFLKKLATEREKAQKKQSVDKVTATPAKIATETSESAPSTAPNTTSDAQSSHESNGAQASQEVSGTSTSADHPKPSTEGESLPTEAQKDATDDRVREESFQDQSGGDGAVANQITQSDGSQQPQNQQNLHMQGMNGDSLGFEGMNNGYPNIAFNNPGDFNAMMQFMPNTAMGAFPNMMGMPGMGMDPMQAMSQGMFGGLGGQGMGMNGMNGMNAGMGFPAGQGWNNGGFNGQPGSWMSGQDKFNQNAYGGHANGMGGDFGANAGYAGYNMPSHQGNYNQMNHHQFPNHDFQNGYHGQGFHNRGRGRGRGYGYAPRGRGGYNQVMPGNQTNNEPFHHQYPPQLDHRGVSVPQHPQQPQDNVRQNDTDNLDVDDFGRTRRPNEEATDEQIARQMAPGDADESPEAPTIAAAAGESAPAAEKDERQVSAVDNSAPMTDPAQPSLQNAQESKDEIQQEKSAPIETFMSDEPSEAALVAPSSAIAVNTMMPPPSPAISQPPVSATSSEAAYEYGFRGRGGPRRLSRGSSDFRGVGRGRGQAHLINGNTNHTISPSQIPPPLNAPSEPKGIGVVGAPKGPKAMREGLPNTGIRGGRGFSIVGRASVVAAHGRTNGSVRSRSRSPTRSRSRSRHRSHHHRSHRHRSPSASADSDREERRRERHRRRSRKYEDEDEEMLDDKEPLESSSRRSSHRSRRDRGEGRDRDGDSEKEDRSSYHRSHRSRRDRDREGESRSTRKRSRTPTATEEINGVETAPHSSSSSRKRRERHEEEDDSRRERKRSRRDREDDRTTSHTEKSSRTQESHTSRHDRHHSTSKNPFPTTKPPTGPRSQQKPQPQQPPPAPKADIDPHELERQARNKERLQKELQRREAIEGKGASSKHPQQQGQRRESKAHGGGGGGRRVSYKFEDELEGGSRVEREREGGRWG
ncbi:MAG: hypothetical protein Q9166_001058 [cf. Caloplaca sp. 2 TL-2023]